MSSLGPTSESSSFSLSERSASSRLFLFNGFSLRRTGLGDFADSEELEVDAEDIVLPRKKSATRNTPEQIWMKYSRSLNSLRDAPGEINQLWISRTIGRETKNVGKHLETYTGLVPD